jgi:hypothetical protein
MSLTGTSSPYTYNSNTSGSTPLTIAQGSGISITRSSNTLNVINTGDLSANNEIQTPTISGNTLGLSGTATTVTVPNIYTANGSIGIGTNRVVTIPSSSSLSLGTTGTGVIEVNNNSGFVEISYGTGGSFITTATSFSAEVSSTNNTGLFGSSSGLVVRTSNNNPGTNGQVLTSNGTQASWQTPTQTFDGIVQESSNSITTSNNADMAVFSTPSSSLASTSGSTTWIKSSAAARYEVTLVITADNNSSFSGIGITPDGKYIGIALMRSGIEISRYRALNIIDNGDDRPHLTFTFLTDGNSGNLTFRNVSGASLTCTVRRIIIKRIL